MQKLPIGVQDFEKIRTGDYAYVDKTELVYRLVTEGAPCFLSRPRRFGKSLLVSTLKYYWQGRRDLFEGLAVERLAEGDPAAWQPHPVFHFDFTGANYTQDGALEAALDFHLREWEGEYGSSVGGLGDRFYALLKAAHGQTGRRAAVLVDEYDKPLLEAMDDPALLERNRATFKAFFSVLKGADAHLQFALITGVTKFSKVSIFSDLNQLRDISLARGYAGVCGVTEAELLDGFGPRIDGMADALGLDRGGCLDALRGQYDGYRFHPGGPHVYNPFSLLNALAKRDLGAYWFESGTPTFLVRRMREANMDLRGLTDGTLWASEARMGDYRADDPDPVPLMYQSGYLTITGFESAGRIYGLGVPNGEVRYGLAESLLREYAPNTAYGSGADIFALSRHMEAGDTDGMRDVLAALFASIPYTREGDPFENYFQAVVYLVFTLLGRFAQVEMRSAAGRVDVVAQARRFVYLMELKRDGSPLEALAQIDERGYAAPFAADSRTLVKIGASFSSETRRLAGWEVG